MTFVILTAGIDLSVGSLVATAGVVCTLLLKAQASLPVVLALGLGGGIAVGLLSGYLSGLVLARFSVAPFIATLAMMTIWRAVAYLLVGGRPVWGLPEAFDFLGSGRLLGIPFPTVVMIVVYAVAWFVLAHTPFGRYVYAVGGNPEAARLAGIQTSRIIVAQASRPAEDAPARVPAQPAHARRDVARGQLVRARGVGPLRDRVRGPPQRDADPDPRLVRGPSDAQGLTPQRHLLKSAKAMLLRLPAGPDQVVINIGPPHPAVHGAFRLQALMDGETIQDSEAEIGYMHRNFEKMAEARTYWQIIPYTDRLNYCSFFMNGHGWALAVEKLLGIEAPPRAEAIRVILSEFSRIMDVQANLYVSA